MSHSNILFVAIGRNESASLRACLESCLAFSKNIVYVDSGSVDNSISIAQAMGAETLSLSEDKPFTAARARNEGAEKGLSRFPNVEFIQFIDADCTLEKNWIVDAITFLQTNTQYDVVCGRRREVKRDSSVYNLLCDIEWNTPVGDADATGGDFLIRKETFIEVHGFNVTLIAGEEPELGYRLRKLGFRLFRLDSPMTIHDAKLSSFTQWSKRARRGGYAYGIWAHLCSDDPNLNWRSRCAGIVFWGIFVPLGMLISLFYSYHVTALLTLIPLVQIIRVAFLSRHTLNENWIYSTFILLAKIPQAIGLVEYVFDKITNKDTSIIEYR